MTQAKGILPRGDDRDVLYKNPRMNGYFIGAKLNPVGSDAVIPWLNQVDALINALVDRLPAEAGEDKGVKVASVAVGLAPSFFSALSAAGYQIDLPAAFARGDIALPGPTGDVDVLFYVASVYEARVNIFLEQLSAMPEIQRVHLERGYQRADGTEPFGYADGLRNIKTVSRPKFVFVHRDGDQPDEPDWADGGSYMVTMKIVQNRTAFAALADDSARDKVIGRTRDGYRLDIVDQHLDPKAEVADVPTGLPPQSHVRKVGPRGRHDDVQIFRRGLPFLEVDGNGQPQVGLHFCSFQASLEQFDVVMNDWLLNQHFPPSDAGTEVGVDALLNPATSLTQIVSAGYFFVPPYNKEGLAAWLLSPSKGKPPKTGTLVVHKRVVDPTDGSRRFERGGFRFRVLDATSRPIPGAEFETASTGRGIRPIQLEVGQNYVLEETGAPPVPPVTLTNVSFTMTTPNPQLQVDNLVTQPGSPYGTQ